MTWRPKHKFKAIACERDGLKFPSKLERKCYDTLKSLQNQGKIRMILRQVPFDLPGCKHTIDFCVFTSENVVFIESKGRDLPMGKLKRKQVEEVYQINIHVAKDPKDIYLILDSYV
jgi:hypothetical protein